MKKAIILAALLSVVAAAPAHEVGEAWDAPHFHILPDSHGSMLVIYPEPGIVCFWASQATDCVVRPPREER